jgi:mono/diheme cytochrome c family protein
MRISHVLTLVLVLGIAPLAARQAGHPKEPHQHAEAAKMQNPVPSSPASLEAGKKLYTELCGACHGDTGKGDGAMASFTGDPPPSDLTDAEWKHGSSDGEIFVTIRDGIEGTGMKDFKDMKPNDIWNIVNYVKTLSPKPAKNH